jgi:hypothetical protein
MPFCVINKVTKIVLQFINQQLCTFKFLNKGMKNLQVKKLILLLLILSLSFSVCEAQKTKGNINNPERALFGKSLNNKTAKYKESPSVVRAKKKQAANEKKLKKEYEAYIKAERKRAVEIQSPEVQTRMINNRKEADLKYKEKKKQRKQAARKTGKKYN